jgi:hypothetical protein
MARKSLTKKKTPTKPKNNPAQNITPHVAKSTMKLTSNNTINIADQ